MNKKDYWKIINHLNKKFFNNKIKINKIIFPSRIIDYKKKDRGTIYGYYRLEDKTIAILKNAPMITQLGTLIHEFTHAYQHQILHKKLTHSEHGWEMMKKMSKEVDKIIKFSV